MHKTGRANIELPPHLKKARVEQERFNQEKKDRYTTEKDLKFMTAEEYMKQDSEDSKEMRKLFITVLFCFSGSALSKEPINLECRMGNGIDEPTFFRLFEDKDEVRRQVDLPVERVTWSPTVVTISLEIERSSGENRRMRKSLINRESLEWTYIDYVRNMIFEGVKCKIVNIGKTKIWIGAFLN